MTKAALITGGSRGIGLGIATELARQGYNLAINGIREEKSVQATLKKLEKYDVRVLYCQGSIAQKNDREKVLEKAIKGLGQLNFLVNNAGIAPRERRDLLEMTEESYREVMSINLEGPLFLSQAAARHMIEVKKDHPGFEAAIVNISSISATVASVNRGEYCISKAGMAMMTMLFATRLGEFNIPVYEVRPGVVETDMTEKVKEKYDKLIDDGLCIQKRWGKPEDVGRVVASMVSGNFSYSTGQVIMVDGGMTVQRL
jgi:NAD(P)-dependent dehydrogenase (short-subunit alcohol dehydrogenase family)